MWDAEGRLVDRNDSFRRVFAQAREIDGAQLPSDDSLTSSDLAGETAFIPPQSAFRGCSSTRLVDDPSDASRLFRFDVWPVRDEEGDVLGVFGRVTPVDSAEIAGSNDPARLTGSLLHDELVRRRASQKPIGLESFIGYGPAHEAKARLVEAAIRADCPVLITGDPGTGRHHLARIIHLRHQAIQGTRLPLIPLDPGSLPSELLLRDFLGVDTLSGSHSTVDTPPQWRVPRGATILIENVAELDTRLQDGIARAQGAIRLISLAQSSEAIDRLEPLFRARAVTIVIELEPLRRRIEEIPLLAQSLLDRLQAGSKLRLEGFTAEAIERLKMYDWPGNWRELERVIRKIHGSAAGPLVNADDIPAEIQGAYGGAWSRPVQSSESPTVSSPLESALQQASRATVLQALQRHGSNKAAVARSLGISRPKLYRLLTDLGIETGEA
jgi:DNA-binding NtrC family response regulator